MRPLDEIVRLNQVHQAKPKFGVNSRYISITIFAFLRRFASRLNSAIWSAENGHRATERARLNSPWPA